MSKALLRGSTKGDFLYVLSCDLNQDPEEGGTVKAAVDSGM